MVVSDTFGERYPQFQSKRKRLPSCLHPVQPNAANFLRITATIFWSAIPRWLI